MDKNTPVPIDWEQRKYEIVKDIVANRSLKMNIVESVKHAIIVAEEVCRQLKSK